MTVCGLVCFITLALGVTLVFRTSDAKVVVGYIIQNEADRLYMDVFTNMSVGTDVEFEVLPIDPDMLYHNKANSRVDFEKVLNASNGVFLGSQGFEKYCKTADVRTQKKRFLISGGPISYMNLEVLSKWPTAEDMLQILWTVLSTDKPSRVGVISDEAGIISDIISNSITPSVPELTCFYVNNGDLRNTLLQLQTVGMTHVILASYNLTFVENTLFQAGALDFLSSYYHWYILYQDSSELIDIIKIEGNDANFYAFDFVPSNGALTKLTTVYSQVSPPILACLHDTKLDLAERESSQTSAFILRRSRQYVGFTLYWNRFFSGIKTFIHNPNDTDFNMDFTVDTTGIATPSFFKHGATVSCRYVAPFLMNLGDGKVEGILQDLMQIYAETLNFTYEFWEVQDGQIGTLHDGIWDGMVADMRNGMTHMAAGLAISVNRSYVVGFSETFLSGTLSLLVKTPIIQHSPWQFLTPFSWQLWLITLGTTVVVGILLFLLTRFDTTTNNIGMEDSLFYSFSLLVSGASDANPTSIPSRMLITVFMFFCVVFVASYIANMAAFLTSRKQTQLLTTMSALAGQTEYSYGVINGSEAWGYLSTANTVPSKTLWKAIQNNPGSILYSYEEAMDRVLSQKYILISESAITKYLVKDNCSFMSIPLPQIDVRYALAYPRGMPFGQLIDKGIIQARKEGKETKVFDKWYRSDTTVCPNRELRAATNTKTKSLSVEEMIGVFVIILVGIGLSLIAGILEYFFRIRRNVKAK